VVNVIGGFIIGMIQHHMPALQSLQVYGLLTIGDGLVAQIPALLISVAAGMLVTRVGAGEGNGLGQQLGSQLFSQPRAIMITSVFLVVFGLIPGLPKVPFFVAAALVGMIGYSTGQANRRTREQSQAQEKEAPAQKAPEAVEELLQVDTMELEIGYGLIALADSSQGGDMLDRVAIIRRQAASEMGIIVPPIRIRDNLKLNPNDYAVKIRGNEIARGSVMPTYYMAMNPDPAQDLIAGIKAVEPAFGLPAVWISENQKSRAESLGYTVVNAVSVVTTHMMEVIRRHAHEILGRQEVRNLLDSLKKTCPAVVEEVVPGLLSVGSVQKVLQNLLHEGVPIRDLVTILEVLGDYAPKIKDTDILTEYVRHALSRSISKLFQDDQGKIRVITLDPHLEDLLSSALKKSGDVSYLALEPRLVQGILDRTTQEVNKIISQGGFQPVVLCSPQVRAHFKRLTERAAPNLAVLSFNEIEPSVSLESVGMVEVN
jgi:flagellar biosynthesis protein FlhA